MTTFVTTSPKAALRRELGLPDVPVSRLTVGSWMKLNIGDRVRERGGRHEGRVEAILWSNLVKVRWDNGWISELELNEVERVGKCTGSILSKQLAGRQRKTDL